MEALKSGQKYLRNSVVKECLPQNGQVQCFFWDSWFMNVWINSLYIYLLVVSDFLFFLLLSSLGNTRQHVCLQKWRLQFSPPVINLPQAHISNSASQFDLKVILAALTRVNQIKRHCGYCNNMQKCNVKRAKCHNSYFWSDSTICQWGSN